MAKARKGVIVTISKFIVFQLGWLGFAGFVALCLAVGQNAMGADAKFVFTTISSICALNIIILFCTAVYNAYLYLRKGETVHSPITCAVFIALNIGAMYLLAASYELVYCCAIEPS